MCQASCDSPGQFGSTTYEAHFRLYKTTLPEKNKRDRAMDSLDSMRQDALACMNIGFFRLPPHLMKSRYLRLTFKPDFLRKAYGAFGAFRTGKHGDFDFFLNVLFHCKKNVEIPIIDITMNIKLGKLRLLTPEVNSNIRY